MQDDRLRILTLNAAIGALDYAPARDGPVPCPGTIVEAPLGPRTITGIVWDQPGIDAGPVDASKLRPIRSILPIPPLSEPICRLIAWTADYYLAHPSLVARMALPPAAALSTARHITHYRLGDTKPERITKARDQVYKTLGNRSGTARELAEYANVSEAVIRGLINAGVMISESIDVDRPFAPLDPDFAKIALSKEQQAAAQALIAAVTTDTHRPFLLDGVTGSGKTEVYLEAIAEALRKGKQTLVLLPEIALTQPFLDRFEKRFGNKPVSWHSGMKQSERRRAWRAITQGTASVVIGARSSLFLPYRNLGLIIVDEAHETSFKQEDGVRYNARDIAVMRAQFEDCPVVLASATPAIESRYMAQIGKYTLLILPDRFGGAREPDIQALDLTEYPPERGRWLAPPMVEAVTQTLARNEQSLLFLNRRGYAPLTLCRTCGHRFQCPNCTAWMVEHRLTARLACHHCGHVMPPPEKCPECDETDALVACGPGVERIADEVAQLFPDARSLIVTSDTIWSPEKAANFVTEVESGAIDIIIGTQLVTKGYHFPNLTFVGVIDADIGLEGGDLRASERSFQQIAQVAGRAGRAEKPGHVLVQTRNPNAPVIDALVRGDREAFYAAETEARKMAGMPPFGRLAALIVSSQDQTEALSAARAIGGSAPEIADFAVYGPAPAPLAMLRGRHRFRLLIHARRNVPLQRIVHQWLTIFDFPRSVRVAVDVDPYSFV